MDYVEGLGAVDYVEAPLRTDGMPYDFSELYSG
jgi:hypothetical protein